MAIVYGDGFTQAYITEPNNQVGGGQSHGTIHVIWDTITAANASDECFIGKVPAGSVLLEVSGTDVSTYTLEDDAGNALAIGDVLAVETVVVAVPSGALANDKVFIKYLQD